VKQALGAQAKESGPQSWRGRRYKIFARSWIDAFTLTSTEAVHPFRERARLFPIAGGFDIADQQTPASDIALFAPAFQIRRAAATNGNDNCKRIKITERKRIAVKPLVCRTVIAILAAACAAQGARAVQPKIVMVAAGVYALLGSGGEITPENGGRTANVAFIVGPRGIVVVDTGTSYREGEEIIAAVKSVSNRPIRLAILTHPGQEAIFGAAAFQARGIPVLAHRRSAALIAARCETCLRNLRDVLGEDSMAASRVVKPDRLIDGNKTLELIGRPLRLIAPQWSSAPGAIAVFDERTSTLIAGSLVSIDRIPDTRDADPKAWRDALVQIESMRCRHLVPGYGPIGSCVNVDAFARYLVELESRVEALMKEGVSLGELRDRCDLPEFARWDQYETLHPQNVNRTYLRLEWSQFK
jgi:glyoxylase-like metal-dependent hydrolase (beta-lactamase superfamily II)